MPMPVMPFTVPAVKKVRTMRMVNKVGSDMVQVSVLKTVLKHFVGMWNNVAFPYHPSVLAKLGRAHKHEI